MDKVKRWVERKARKWFKSKGHGVVQYSPFGKIEMEID